MAHEERRVFRNFEKSDNLVSLPNVLKSSDKGISIPFELTFLTGILEFSVKLFGNARHYSLNCQEYCEEKFSPFATVRRHF